MCTLPVMALLLKAAKKKKKKKKKTTTKFVHVSAEFQKSTCPSLMI